MSVKEISIGGIITLVVFFLIFCGVGPTWNLIKNIASGVWKILIFLPQFIKPFIPFLGIKEITISLFVFGLILSFLLTYGIVLSCKHESNLWLFISGMVEIISILITISSGVQM